MRYIRSKNNPLQILSFGYVQPGGLGEVPEGFEEVEGDLPAGAVLEQVQPVGHKLDALFMQQPVAMRVTFYMVKVAVRTALESVDLEAAHLLIANAPVSDELKPVRDQMLNLLQQEMSQAST